jgi:membrane-bound lytic murein transglycosylase D
VAELQAPNDVWERIRRGFAIPDLDNELVRDKEQWYSSRPEYIQRMTERSSKYLFHIVEEIERRGMPMELALLPYIESAFNPQAVSHAKAAGMWQFMPATGQSFDLKQNVFRDDRRDVLASTKAALDYLQQLHQRFGDWHLALAAYNWGQGNINRAITRNTRDGLSTAYTELNMPLETRQYVPKLQAVKNIIARPQVFGVRLPEIGNYPFFDSVVIDRDIDVALIAKLAGVSENDFRTLNPSLNKPMVMAAATPEILLPRDNAIGFLTQLRLHKGPTASWTAWVVPQTMSVTQAAQRVSMDESTLRELNKIPPRMMVRAGSSLLVERGKGLDKDIPEHVVDSAQLSFHPEVVLRRVTVKARKGETIAKLAKRYGVSAAQVANWNALSSKARLKTGQQLTLMMPRKAATEQAQPKSKTKLAKKSGTKKVQAKAKTQKTAKKRPATSKKTSPVKVASAKPKSKK